MKISYKKVAKKWQDIVLINTFCIMGGVGEEPDFQASFKFNPIANFQWNYDTILLVMTLYLYEK